MGAGFGWMGDGLGWICWLGGITIGFCCWFIDGVVGLMKICWLGWGWGMGFYGEYGGGLTNIWGWLLGWYGVYGGSICWLGPTGFICGCGLLFGIIIGAGCGLNWFWLSNLMKLLGLLLILGWEGFQGATLLGYIFKVALPWMKFWD